jgi:hypothetical protein
VPTAKAQEQVEGCSSISEGAILITCDTTFEQAAKNINDDSVLRSLGNGEYLLNSDLHVEEGARLTIASPEVKWVKISNEGSLQYSIVVNGYMDIDGVKITSWDPEENSVVYQDSLGSVLRPYIHYQDADGGVIQNSELAHTGYDGEKGGAFHSAGRLPIF